MLSDWTPVPRASSFSGFRWPSQVCRIHKAAPQGPAAGCRHVLAHRRQPRVVTWRSCALCSHSRPGRWCPRFPLRCTSSSSSCGASSPRLQSRTRTGHGRRKTGVRSDTAQFFAKRTSALRRQHDTVHASLRQKGHLGHSRDVRLLRPQGSLQCSLTEGVFV